MSIGERLKIWRKTNQLTSKQVEAVTGISQAAISLYENNKREVSIAYIIALYEHYNIDIVYILTGKMNEKHLSTEQEQLLQYFKLCDYETKEDILRFVKRCASTQRNNDDNTLLVAETSKKYDPTPSPSSDVRP